MIARNALIAGLNELLTPSIIPDYCPNGLQVQGTDNIQHIISGVSASRELIETAIDKKADTILVHHGYFWKSEPAEVVGMKYQRLKLLLANDINLIAYHLPLDVHQTLGNNAQLARVLGINNCQSYAADGIEDLFWTGEFDSQFNINDCQQHITQSLGRTPLVIEGGHHPVKTIGFCTGGAQKYIEMAAALGCDAYLSGEVSEPTTHVARELGVHYLAAGHHATERYGVKALGEWIAQQFDVTHEFIDIDNPV